MGLLSYFTTKKPNRTDFENEALPHFDALYQAAYYLTRDSRDAEDLVQETFMKAYRFFHTYKSDTNCRAWLFRILHNTFINTHRKKVRSIECVDTHDFSDREERFIGGDVTFTTPEQEVSRSEVQNRIRAAIEELPTDFKMVTILRDLEGFSYNEIAQIMDTPVGTVMSRIFRSRKLLKDTLSDLAHQEGLGESDSHRSSQHKKKEPISLAEYRAQSRSTSSGRNS